MAAGCLPGDPSQPAFARGSDSNLSQDEILMLRHKWYYTKEEIENHSPSIRAGMSLQEESHLRGLYCTYIQELGMEIKVPQKTIASALVLCHRFYMRQSHTKNYWQTVAASCVLLASKSEETPCFLKDVVVVGYKLANKRDPEAVQKIKQKELFEKQKETLLYGERLLLATLNFELNIELPYKPLVAAVKNLGISRDEVPRVAWNYVNDWLRTTFCLQYKPHYIAAGSLFLAARRQKVKLPSLKEKAWWTQFEVHPKILDGLIKHMARHEELALRQALPSPGSKAAQAQPECKTPKASFSSPESCVSNGSIAAQGTDKKKRLESEGASRPTESVSNAGAQGSSRPAQSVSNASVVAAQGSSRPVQSVSSGSAAIQDPKTRIRLAEADYQSKQKASRPAETVSNASVAAAQGSPRPAQSVSSGSAAIQDTKYQTRLAEADHRSRQNASIAAAQGSSRPAHSVSSGSAAIQDSKNRTRLAEADHHSKHKAFRPAEPESNASVAAAQGSSRPVQSVSSDSAAIQDTKYQTRLAEADHRSRQNASRPAEPVSNASVAAAQGSSRPAHSVSSGSAFNQDSKSRTRLAEDDHHSKQKAFRSAEPESNASVAAAHGSSRPVQSVSSVSASLQDTKYQTRLAEADHRSRQNASRPAEPVSNAYVAAQGSSRPAHSVSSGSASIQDFKSRTRLAEADHHSKHHKAFRPAEPESNASVAAAQGSSRPAHSVSSGSASIQDSKNRTRLAEADHHSKQKAYRPAEPESNASAAAAAAAAAQGSSRPLQSVSSGSASIQDSKNRTQLAEADHHSKQKALAREDMKRVEAYKKSDTYSPTTGVEGLIEQKKPGYKREAPSDSYHRSIDVNRIKERMKKRKLEQPAETKRALDGDTDEAWIEMELESGLQK